MQQIFSEFNNKNKKYFEINISKHFKTKNISVNMRIDRNLNLLF